MWECQRTGDDPLNERLDGGSEAVAQTLAARLVLLPRFEDFVLRLRAEDHCAWHCQPSSVFRTCDQGTAELGSR